MDKIRTIQVIPLIRRLDRVFSGSTYQIVSRNTIYARIETEGGIVGEAFGGDEDIHQEKVVQVANDSLAPGLIGAEIWPVEPLWRKMFSTPDLPLHNRGIHTLDMINHAILMQAIAIIDLAIWDAVGKSFGQPLWQLLGGFRSRVPVVGIGGYYKPGAMEELGGEIQLCIDLGLAGIKLKVGKASVDEDIRRVEYIRKHFAETFVVACDANQAWTYEQALRFARGVADLNLEWLEEPVVWYDQLEGLKRLRSSTAIPLVAGQGEISKWGCRDLILGGCVDTLNVDATIAAGITEWMRIASFAETMDVNMGHHEEPQVALHLLGGIPNSTYVEIFHQRERDPMWYELVADLPRIADGFMYPNDAPGLGWHYNAEIIDRYGQLA